MFNKPTTFVIGAGCSHEYGFPLGNGLRDEIAAMLEQVKPDRPQRSDRMIFTTGKSDKDSDFNAAIVLAAGNHKWQEWFASAQSMATGLRHGSSIDRYLDFHNDDPVKVQIGKMAIGRSILRAEARSSLAMETSDTFDMAEIFKKNGDKPHWLNELFLRLQEGVRRGNVADIIKNVTFVCFNYDRAIEHYLYNAVKAFGNLTEGEATDALRHLKVYHPYGRLGHLFWENATTPQGVHYGARLDDWRSIASIGENLRIFTETIEENDEIRCIRNAMMDTNKIVFMGFSFLQQNLDLIRPPARSNASQVWATTYGMSEFDVDAAKSSIDAMLQGTNSGAYRAFAVRVQNSKAGQFLADTGNLLRS